MEHGDEAILNVQGGIGQGRISCIVRKFYPSYPIKVTISFL